MLNITAFAAKIAEIESYPDNTPFIWRESIERHAKGIAIWTDIKTHVLYKSEGAIWEVEESLMGHIIETSKLTFELSEECVSYFLKFRKSSREEVVDSWIEEGREISQLRHQREGKLKDYPKHEKQKKKMLTAALKFLK